MVPEHNMNVISGSSVVVPCTVNGTSPITYLWYHGNKIVSRNHELRIDNVSITDVGPYKCSVRNLVGEHSTLLYLVVECKFIA